MPAMSALEAHRGVRNNFKVVLPAQWELQDGRDAIGEHLLQHLIWEVEEGVLDLCRLSQHGDLGSTATSNLTRGSKFQLHQGLWLQGARLPPRTA